MKKVFLAVALVLIALGVLTAGAAYAQGVGGGPGMMTNGEGPLHDYILKAYADALGLTVDALEARLAKGETVYQIALAQGIAADQIPTLLAEARAKAFDAAVAASVITADQAAWMKSHGFGQDGRGYGMGTGPCNGTGQPVGSGMMRGGRWGQANP